MTITTSNLSGPQKARAEALTLARDVVLRRDIATTEVFPDELFNAARFILLGRIPDGPRIIADSEGQIDDEGAVGVNTDLGARLGGLGLVITDVEQGFVGDRCKCLVCVAKAAATKADDADEENDADAEAFIPGLQRRDGECDCGTCNAIRGAKDLLAADQRRTELLDDAIDIYRDVCAYTGPIGSDRREMLGKVIDLVIDHLEAEDEEDL